MQNNNFTFTGLTTEEVLYARQQHGENKLQYKKENAFTRAVTGLIKEPMVILLLAASVIYFISGNMGDAFFLAASIILVAAISLYQDNRSRNALKKLEAYTSPTCKVIRNGHTEEINSGEVVTGDFIIAEEGTTVAADGEIVQSNDFSVNESILTGESLPVYKASDSQDNKVYMGTTVGSGLAIIKTTAIGNNTKLGSIGKSLEAIKQEKTPLELQVNNFVKKMVAAGAVVFVIVWGINFYNSHSVLDSLLKALTLAMSILPEEIPVAFTTFMALGAWRLMKMGIIVKQMKTVETLGSATVICTDKTGTLTENKMSLAKIFTLSSRRIISAAHNLHADEKGLVRIAMWASEPIPFDPMEKALHDAYSKLAVEDERPLYHMAHEYPLGGKPPMMTHIFEDVAGNRIIAAKGAPEAIMAVCKLSPAEKSHVENALQEIAVEGYRVLGVAEGFFEGNNFPAKQQQLPFTFKGLVAFYDPPKKNIAHVLKAFYRAGIKVKIVTGDSAATTDAIARQIEFKGCEKSISGDELVQLDDRTLLQKVGDTNIFTRMFPGAKLKIIHALKAKQEIVAMTGDGVNDGPALKAAHIGIAMGKKGTDIAKQAASLILTEDDLSKMVDAVAMGRRIYANLKKAIQYIISIHIPIILTVFIPLAMGWLYPNIFSPVHIIFFELIMGPTCSIIYENEPMEKNTMFQKPRPFTTTFFSWRELGTSTLQGLIITVGVLAVYQYAVHSGYAENLTRAMAFTTLISANIFLTLVNRSFYYSFITTISYRNSMMPLIIGITITITAMLLYVAPLAAFFKFAPLTLVQLGICAGAGFIASAWFEVLKWSKRLAAK